MEQPENHGFQQTAAARDSHDGVERAGPSDGAERSREKERTTHRLEAFSDIVIGFSLAQLGLSLVLPGHAVDFVQRPVGIIAFLITFAVIARFWWTHFVIFEHYFVPNRLMIACNFVALATMILLIFSLQLYLHFVPLGQGIVASRIYFGTFVISYGLLDAMIALGLRYRWNALSLERRRTGIQSALRLLGTVAGCALGNLFAGTDHVDIAVGLPPHEEIVATFPLAIVLYTFVGWLIATIAAAIVLRRTPSLQSE